LDIEALLLRGGGNDSQREPKRAKLHGKIGTEDPAKDFKELIDNEENSWKPGSSLMTKLMKVFKEIEKVIKDVVSKSFADQAYAKAIKAIRAYRAEAINVPLSVNANSSLMNRVNSTTF
jgi:Ku C terminal domain like